MDDFGTSIGYLQHARGWPQILTTTVAYSRESAPAHSFLAERIQQLQSRFPDLRLKMVPSDPKAKEDGVHHPAAWSQGARSWPTDSVLESCAVHGKQSTIDAWNHARQTLESRALDRNPMFLVLRMESEETVYVSLSVSHCLMDGMGMVNFLKALVAPDMSGLPDESSAGNMVINAGRVFKIVPEKPYEPWTAPEPKENPDLPVWPHSKDEYRAPQSLDHAPVFVPLDIPTSTTTQLKKASTAHNLATINPILLASFIEALASTLNISERRLMIIVPRSMRSSQDPYLFGGHNDNYEFSVSAEDSQSRSTWDTARAIADDIAALQAEMDKPSSDAPAPDTGPQPSPSPATIIRRTDESMQHIPFRYSFIWSNLTKWSWLDDIKGVQDVIWGQSMTIFPSPIMVNLSGWKGGVRAIVGIRAGCALNKEELDRVVDRWKANLENAQS